MSTAVQPSRSAAIHQHLAHPVVDADAHWLESVPVFHDYVRATGGPQMLDAYVKSQSAGDRWFQTPAPDRLRHRVGRPNYWFGPGNTLDRATSMIPRLLYQRLQDFGIEFAVVYPTLGARLQPLFSSDISHFDVTDMTEVLEEAWELVEHELIDEAQFRDLTFSHTVALHGKMNPDFFKGMAVEDAAAREMARLNTTL
jgi:hypothetical protein